MRWRWEDVFNWDQRLTWYGFLDCRRSSLGGSVKKLKRSSLNSFNRIRGSLDLTVKGSEKRGVTLRIRSSTHVAFQAVKRRLSNKSVVKADSTTPTSFQDVMDSLWGPEPCKRVWSIGAILFLRNLWINCDVLWQWFHNLFHRALQENEHFHNGSLGHTEFSFSAWPNDSKTTLVLENVNWLLEPIMEVNLFFLICAITMFLLLLQRILLRWAKFDL